MTRRFVLRIVAAMCLVAMAAVADISTTAVPAAAQTTPATNPPIPDQCGLPMTLVLDASGSIQSSKAVEDVRDAAEAFLDAIKDTGSTARVVDFGTFSRQTAGPVLVTTQSMAPGGAHFEALLSYYNPIPPVTAPSTAAREYDGSGSISNTANFGSIKNDQTQYTNWDSALDRARAVPSELIVFVTDGDPTALDLNQPGDAFNPLGTTVAFNTFRGDLRGPSVDRAVQEANAAKGASTRILAVGVGAAVTQDASVARLVQVSGPKVVRDASQITDLNQVDVAVVPDFDDLAAALRRVVTELCSPSLTIRKFVQTADSIEIIPGPGWSTTVTPTVTGGTFDWILPDTADAASKTVITDGNGFAQYQWEPSPSTAPSTAAVSEVVQAGYAPGPARCEIVGPTGPATFLDFPSSASFTVPVGSQDIVTCALTNNFIYTPAINIVKTPAPTVVRGDNGGTDVIYTGTVTIPPPGNTPLTIVDGDDSDCQDIEFIGGDTDGDAKLDLTETWTYQCTRRLQASLTQDEILVPNTAFITGVAPNGVQVTDDDDAEVEVLTPAIRLEKTPSATLVPPGTPVTYTFTVTNAGNDPLSNITLVDSNPECLPTLISGDDGDDLILGLTETWTFTCEAVIVDDPTINQATVTGTPTLGPTVDWTDNAEVGVVVQDLELQKRPPVAEVFAGDPHTYTFLLTNVGEDDLTPPEGQTPATVLTDSHCAPVVFDATSDVGPGGTGPADGILSAGETWTYTCTATITENVLNLAAAGMTGPLGPINAFDTALVVPLTSGIAIVKTASDDVVRTGTEVTYRFEVSNAGQTSLAGVTTGLVDSNPECVPTFVDGDTDGDTLLDVGEVFIFTCTATLTETTTNTATVSGTPTLSDGRTDDPVTSEDSATVEVFSPDIALTKEASAEAVRVGTPVTFTFVATNTGNSDLFQPQLADDGCLGITFVGESVSDDGVMQPGESWTWECTKDMNVTTTNQATVVAIDLEGEPVTAPATDTVEVFDSSIALTKDVDPILVPEGGTTTFTFTVTNPSEVPLTDITITDDTCSPLTFVGGDTNGDNALAPNEGESWVFACTTPITQLTSNSATVTGTDPSGFEVEDSAAAGALPYLPGIAVTKTASPTEVPVGGEVTYRYEVVNTGNIPLVVDSITDDTCSPVNFVEGDTDGNGFLTGEINLYELSAEAEVWIFTCTTTVESDTINTVTVTGVPSDLEGDPLGPPVNAQAVAAVAVTAQVSPAPEVPDTGSNTWPMVRAGLASIAAGSVLVALAWNVRRRRHLATLGDDAISDGT